MEEAATHWYQNPDWWSAIGTIFAACVALSIASYTEVSGRVRRRIEAHERRKCLAVALLMDLVQTAKTVDELLLLIDQRSKSSQPSFQVANKPALRLPELTHLFGSVAQFYVLGREASADVLALAAEIRSWNHDLDLPSDLLCAPAHDRMERIKSLIESSHRTLDALAELSAA